MGSSCSQTAPRPLPEGPRRPHEGARRARGGPKTLCSLAVPSALPLPRRQVFWTPDLCACHGCHPWVRRSLSTLQVAARAERVLHQMHFGVPWTLRDGSRASQDGPKTVQDSPRRPKRAPRRPKIVSRRPRRAPRRPKMASRRVKRAPRRSKVASRQPEGPPRRPKSSPRGPPAGPPGAKFNWFLYGLWTIFMR